MYCKPQKCEFEKEQTEYLGMVISHNSVSMDPTKLTGIKNWPNPDDNKTSPIIPWIRKLLLKIYQEVRTFGKTVEQPIEEGRHLRMDKRMPNFI